MGTLSTEKINEWLNHKFPDTNRLVITPLLDREVQTKDNSVDLRLGNEFIITKRTSFPYIDVANKKVIEKDIGQYQERIIVGFKDQFVLHPNQLILGSTLEYISLPNKLSAYVLGRSSWGRLGLIIATATTVSPNFKGCITLELINLGEVPIILYPGVRIAQLVIHTVEGEGLYTGRYSCPTGPEFSRIYRDEEIEFWGQRKTKKCHYKLIGMMMPK
jgi:dCTP deaminase